MKIITINREKCLRHPRCQLCDRIIPGLLPHISKMGSAVVQDWAWQEHKEKITNLVEQCPAGSIEVQE